MLAKAISRVFGYPTDKAETPLEFDIEVLNHVLGRFGPVRVVIGWAEQCPELAAEVASLVGAGCQLIVVSANDGLFPKKLNLSPVDAAFLKMRPEEALVAGSNMAERRYMASLMHATDGNFGAFLKHVGTHELSSTIDTSVGVRDYPFSGDQNQSESFLEALWKHGRLAEAFDIACTEAPLLVPKLVDEAANYFFDRGAFGYLWDCLRNLPPETKTDPNVAYWLYAAAAATNRLSDVQGLAEIVLRAADAPDLRAAVAVMRPGAHTEEETLRALSASETAITVRARAFSLALNGDRHSPIKLLRRAMALAEQAGANHLVIACALDISNQEITLGRLRSGRDWALWALQQYEVRQIAEEHRRQTALSGVAFSKILMGDDDTESIISAIDSNVSRLGIPTYESVISTVGDWHLVQGHPGKAGLYYKCVLDRVPLSQYASSSVDVVKALIAQGKNSAALNQAELAYSLSRSSSAIEKAFGCLALGMANSLFDVNQALVLLGEAQVAFSRTSFALFEATALLWTANVEYGRGNFEAAKNALKLASPVTEEFGLSGWRFCISNLDQARRLYELHAESQPNITLRFLGDSKLIVGGEQLSISLRHCEILAMLAERPNGISSERLQLLIFGDNGKVATTKSTVSRLRRLVPISVAPYRLLTDVNADFCRVLSLLEQGEVQRALKLYRGPLLPQSDAPGVIELREQISEALRRAVLGSKDVDLLIQLGTVMEDDLEIWEHARTCLAPDDRRKPLVNARIRRVKANW